MPKMQFRSKGDPCIPATAEVVEVLTIKVKRIYTYAQTVQVVLCCFARLPVAWKIRTKHKINTTSDNKVTNYNFNISSRLTSQRHTSIRQLLSLL